MRAVLAWSDKPPEKDGIPNVCYGVCFRPDGSQLVAGVGNRVIAYDTATGEPIHTLKGHKDSVYCVAYSRDGKRFASGAADKTVIVWSAKAEGLVKYTHNETIQAVEYNPVTHQLVSVTAIDFGLWSPEEKSVAKHKVTSKILCVSWTNDGQFLALGMLDGTVRIHNKSGAEQIIIQHRDTLQVPVWSVSWSILPEDNPTLAVGTWDGTLAFYALSGQQVHRDRELGFDPTCVTHNVHGDLLCVAGTDRKVTMYTKEGQKLSQLIERPSWIWSAKYQGKSPNIGVGCQDGTVALYNVIFSTVHGLYQDRYAYRENITDVIVQHLITEAKVRIHCRDHVKRISVYKDKVAVQLPERVIIYELQNKDDPYDMQYRVTAKIHKKLDCNLLVLTSQHLILCLERKFQMYTLEAELIREWQLDSTIRYIKVLGGAIGREGLLVGLKSGEVFKIFVDNPFPIPVLKHDAPIRCLDFSLNKTKLAVVDDNSNVSVYDTRTKALLYQASGANSVSWNAEFDDMLCYSGNGMLSIKTADFPVHQQKLQGFVVGFKGSKIFCLQYVSMTTIDVPHSASMVRYLENKDYDNAYKVARLGVTESDWRTLGREATMGLQLEIALRCFIRVRDARMIDKLHRLHNAKRAGRLPAEDALLADLKAYLGQYREAAEIYKKMGRLDLAMAIFLDLRQFDEAKRWAEELTRDQGDSEIVRDLMLRQAEWFEEAGDHSAAAEMYRTARKYDRAVHILTRSELWEPLSELCRGLPAKELKPLTMAAEALRKAGRVKEAREIFTKLQDFRSVAQILVDGGLWDEAHELMQVRPEVKEIVMLPYATWLALQDRFDEARVAYKAAGKPEASVHVLEQLAHNGVVECRFADAAFYFYHLAMEALGSVQNPADRMTSADRRALDRYADMYHRAELYYAYDFVHRSVDDPFCRTDASVLFDISRYLLMRILQRTELQRKEAPLGISLVNIILTLAKFAEKQGAFKMARMAYQRLQSLKLPEARIAEVELASIRIRTQPFVDAEELQPVCYRCGAPNPLLNLNGDQCVQCQTEFVRSYLTFELLPLVEFQLDPDISDDEALQLLEMEPPLNNNLQRAHEKRRQLAEGYAREMNQGGAQMLRLEDDYDDREIATAIEDPFISQRDLRMITVGRDTLRALQRSEVLVRTWPNAHIRPQYFRLMDRDTPICLGPDGHFYEHDEYEMVCLERESTPFARQALSLEHEIATVDRHYIRGLPAAQALAQTSSGAEGADGHGHAGGGRAGSLASQQVQPPQPQQQQVPQQGSGMTYGGGSAAAAPAGMGRNGSRNDRDFGGWGVNGGGAHEGSAFMPPPGVGGTMGRPRTGAQSQGF